jgi:hypothetical protein
LWRKFPILGGNKKKQSQTRDQRSFGENFPKSRHIWRKKSFENAKIFEGFWQISTYFFWNRHI